jgi:hypothetical protein
MLTPGAAFDLPGDLLTFVGPQSLGLDEVVLQSAAMVMGGTPGPYSAASCSYSFKSHPEIQFCVEIAFGALLAVRYREEALKAKR